MYYLSVWNYRCSRGLLTCRDIVGCFVQAFLCCHCGVFSGFFALLLSLPNGSFGTLLITMRTFPTCQTRLVRSLWLAMATLFMLLGCVSMTGDGEEVLTRSLYTLPHGRIMFKTTRPPEPFDTVWLTAVYCSRALEWVSPSRVMQPAVDMFLPGTTFKVSYSNVPSMSDTLYKPRTIFTGFSIEELLLRSTLGCTCAQRLDPKFLDSRTLDEFQGLAPTPQSHIRTKDHKTQRVQPVW